MLSKALREKIGEWTRELKEIQEKMDAINGKKEEAASVVRASLKSKNPDDVIAAQQAEARLGEELQALKLIKTEIEKAYPVDRDTFQQEFAGFLAQQKEILDKEYNKIEGKLWDLEYTYSDYEKAHQACMAELRVWQNLAEKIGIRKPAGPESGILRHGQFRSSLSRLVRPGTGGVI